MKSFFRFLSFAAAAVLTFVAGPASRAGERLAEVDEIFSAQGRRVVTLGQDSGTYIETGRSMVAPTASFWTLNGRCQVVRFEQYIDTLQVRSAIDIDP